MPKYIIDTDAGTCVLYSTTQPVVTPPPAPQPAPQPVVTPPPAPPPISSWGTVNTEYVNMPWASTGLDNRPTTHNFTDNTTVVLQFTVPTDAPVAQIAHIVGFEREGGYVPRMACLNTVPVTFEGNIQLVSNDGSPSFWLVVGTIRNGFVTVEAGKTYYINIVNRNSRGQSTGVEGITSNMWFGNTVR